MKTFKAGKINGIEKSVCCREQKVAYNICHSYGDIYTSNGDTKFLECVRMLLKDSISSSFNHDLIYHIVLFNYKDYVKAGRKILTSYQEIGNNFKIGYPII
jgi:hypothetical protein